MDEAYRGVVPHCRVFATYNGEQYTNGFVPLQAGVSGITSSQNGPEIGLGFRWYEATGRDLYIIKYARGGKHVANDDLSNSFYPVGGAMYAELQATVSSAFGILGAQGIVPASLSIVDWQGESDCTDERSAAFSLNKELEISSLRTWIAEQGFYSGGIPVVLTKIYMETGNIYIDTVRAATATAATNLGNASTVDAQGIVSLMADNIHADADTGAYSMGVAYADAAIALLQAQGTLP